MESSVRKNSRKYSDKLSQTSDHLREMDNTRSEFLSIASHQLGTPLTAIKGYVSLFLEGACGPVTTKEKEVLKKVFLWVSPKVT